MTLLDAMFGRRQELKELISSYQGLRESGRGAAICSTIIETARQCNLDKDVALPEDPDTKDMSTEERDTIIGRVYSKYAYLPFPFPSTALPYLLLRQHSHLWPSLTLKFLCHVDLFAGSSAFSARAHVRPCVSPWRSECAFVCVCGVGIPVEVVEEL